MIEADPQTAPEDSEDDEIPELPPPGEHTTKGAPSAQPTVTDDVNNFAHSARSSVEELDSGRLVNANFVEHMAYDQAMVKSDLRTHCVACAEAIVRFDTEVATGCTNGIITDQDARELPRYCQLCEMWLCSLEQWIDNRGCKKHKRRRKWFRQMCIKCIHLGRYKDVDFKHRKPKVSVWTDGCWEDFPGGGSMHPYLSEAAITSRSRASAALEDVQRTVSPPQRNLLADDRLSRSVRRVRRMRKPRPSGCHVSTSISEDSTRLQRPHRVCSQCGFSDVERKLRKCSGCYVARYCSRECQQTHWLSHKVDCRNLTVSSDLVIVEASARSDSDDSDWTLVSDSESSDSDWTLVRDSEPSTSVCSHDSWEVLD